MKTLVIELKKQRRSGLLPLLPMIGVLGAGYAFLNFALRGDALLRLPMAPMDLLLTELNGMLMLLDMFGLIAAACMAYRVEFMGSAAKKLYTLPVRAAGVYLSKFFILAVLYAAALMLQNLALTCIGQTVLPPGEFEMEVLIRFALYVSLSALPVLSFMLLIASRLENSWAPLSIGVLGFLSAMALVGIKSRACLLHPFVLMLKPAMSMTARPDIWVMAVSWAETLLFLGIGLWTAARLHYE